MKKEELFMKKKTLLAPSLFLSGILLFSGCGSSATTSAVHQNKSADSWAVEASEPLDDSGFSYDGEADMMDDTATADTAGSFSDSSGSNAAADAAEATHDQSTRKLIRTVSMDIATEIAPVSSETITTTASDASLMPMPAR